MPTNPNTATEMFKADVAAAGIEDRDQDGRVVDFHALRHTFVTNLARSGVHPKTAQALARHSTITLTMDRYSHTVIEEQADALKALPDLSGPDRSSLRKTGTEDGQPIDGLAPRLASCLAEKHAKQETPADSGGPPSKDALDSAESNNPQETRGLLQDSQRRGRDSNPRYPCGYNGFRDRPDQPLRHLSECLLASHFRLTADFTLFAVLPFSLPQAVRSLPVVVTRL